MDRMRLFDTSFRLGCGSSLDDVLASESFWDRLEAEKSLLARYPPTTYRGLALRVGHLEMGSFFLWWLHQKYELRNRKFGKRSERRLMREEARTCFHKKGNAPFEWNMRSLIHTLGNALVQTAIAILPSEIRLMAEQWKTADFSRQQEIVGELHRFLGRREKEEEEKDEQFQRMRDRSYDRFLPRVCSPDRLPIALNCLGKAQLVAAFASLAGAQAYALHPTDDSATKHRQFDKHTRLILLRDLEERPELTIPADFLTTLKGKDDGGRSNKNDTSEFHVVVIVEMREGRWALLDPNFSSGVLSEWWNMPLVHRLLQKYGDVLPGLTLPAGDMGCADNGWYTDADKELDHARWSSLYCELLLTKALGEKFFNKVYTANEEYWTQKGFSAPLFGRLPDKDKIPSSMEHAEALEMLFPDLSIEEQQLALQDEQRVWQKLSEFVTLYHAQALSKLRRRLWDFSIIQPYGAVGNCAYQLATDVLCSVGNLTGWNWLKDTLLIDHVFNDICLSNTLRATSSDGYLVNYKPGLRAKLERIHETLDSWCNGHDCVGESIRRWKDFCETETITHSDLKEVAQ